VSIIQVENLKMLEELANSTAAQDWEQNQPFLPFLLRWRMVQNGLWHNQERDRFRRESYGSTVHCLFFFFFLIKMQLGLSCGFYF
jgi:hypothetical protein